MSQLVPFNGFTNLSNSLFNRTFQEMVRDLNRVLYEDTGTTFWAPRVNISETPSEILISADLPGIRQDDLTIQMEGNTLILKGERPEEVSTEGENFHRVEKSYGTFQRTFNLPMSVQRDAIKATLKDGVLRLSVPKAEEAKPKLIPIQVEGDD